MQRVKLSKRSRLKLLIYGKPGKGKTTFAGTAGLDDRTAPVLWIEAGGNPIVLTRLKDARIDVLQVEQLGDLATIYSWLNAGQPANNIFARDHNLNPPYKTLVFDGITHLQRLAFDAVMNTGDLLPGLVPPKPEWTHYRSVLGQMVGIASKYYTLTAHKVAPIHVIVTALEHPEQRFLVPGDTKTQYIYFEPLLAGQSVDEVPGWALNVGRVALTSTYDDVLVRNLKAEDAYNILQFQATRYVDAKDQHAFGPYHANPTITKLLDIMDAKAPPNSKTIE